MKYLRYCATVSLGSIELKAELLPLLGSTCMNVTGPNVESLVSPVTPLGPGELGFVQNWFCVVTKGCARLRISPRMVWPDTGSVEVITWPF